MNCLESNYVEICLAGDKDEATKICQEFCDKVGLCVTISETSFVYTGGKEFGIIVRLVNYPRFPSSDEKLWNTAEKLATELIVGLEQKTALLLGKHKTLWINYNEAYC